MPIEVVCGWGTLSVAGGLPCFYLFFIFQLFPPVKHRFPHETVVANMAANPMVGSLVESPERGAPSRHPE